VWERLVRAHRGESVLVSAHGHLNRVLLLHALALPREAFWSVPQPNSACVVLDVCAGGTVATLLAAA
jgi:broad specificity phosphatase PhoE